MNDTVLHILESHPRTRESLIPVLQEVQGNLGYLPEDTIEEISKFLRISRSDIYGVASFYAQFRFKRPGQHIVKVCDGTACHVRGAEKILTEVEKQLGIHPKESTPDYKFSLETVACFGACALAPVLVVDEKVYGRMTIAQVKKVLEQY